MTRDVAAVTPPPGRPIDKAATKAARARQAAGFARLDDACGIPTWIRRLRGYVTATSLRPPYLVEAVAPPRRKPGVPRTRSDAAWLRKRRRDAARRARRENRR